MIQRGLPRKEGKRAATLAKSPVHLARGKKKNALEGKKGHSNRCDSGRKKKEKKGISPAFEAWGEVKSREWKGRPPLPLKEGEKKEKERGIFLRKRPWMKLVEKKGGSRPFLIQRKKKRGGERLSCSEREAVLAKIGRKILHDREKKGGRGEREKKKKIFRLGREKYKGGGPCSQLDFRKEKRESENIRCSSGKKGRGKKPREGTHFLSKKKEERISCIWLKSFISEKKILLEGDAPRNAWGKKKGHYTTMTRQKVGGRGVLAFAGSKTPRQREKKGGREVYWS